MLAGWLVAFIAMQMASTPHAASTERKREGDRGWMLRVYALFPASLYLLFSSFLPFSPSFIHSPQSFALFLFLLYPLYPFFILLFLLNSPLAFSLPLQFRVICAYIRPFGLYIISTLPRYCHSRKNLFFRKKKKKKRKENKGIKGRKKQTSMILAI